MYSTILHATDLRENHFNLCQKAVDLAKIFNAKIYFMHVIEQPTSLQIAQSLGFAELAMPIKEDAEIVMRLLGEAVNVPPENQIVEIGSVHQRILEKIKQLSCDMLILGSHSSHGIPEFLGSTAHAVMQHAECDVITLRAQ